MDIYCTRCSEPIDMDYLHDLVEEGMYANFKEALHAFQTKGCEALGEPQCERSDSLRAAAMGAMFDLLGDDVDGAAAMMDDFEYMGAFE